MKVFVTGNAGSGKSTLGKKIAAELGLPFYTLDKIVWQEGWQKTPADEKKKRISQLTSGERWVVDGVSPAVQEEATLVIFLDVPRRISFYRALKRSSKHLFSSRPDLPPNCPEILIIPTLVKIIWRFPRRIKPGIVAHGQARGNASFVHITSKSDLEHFISDQLPSLGRNPS